MGLKTNNCRTYSGLVETYIGTAYDTVKFVADNMAFLTSVSANLEYYNDTYYGPLDYIPVTRIDGSAMEEGDMYFNTNLNSMFVFDGAAWTGMGETQVVAEIVTIDSANIVGNDTVVTFENSYVTNDNAILVYVGGVYQYSQFTDPTGAYLETDAHTITFPDVNLLIGETVSAVMGQSVNTVNSSTKVTKARYVTTLPSETLIPIPDGLSYEVGSDDLTVFLDGLAAYPNTDYYESSPGTITLLVPASVGTEILFTIGHLLTNVPNFNADIITINLVADFYNNVSTINTEKSTYARGRSTLSDGGEGIFTFNPNTNKSVANGGSVIDNSVDLNSQGTGIGLGCWIRQYDEEVNPQWWGYNGSDMATFKYLKGIAGDSFNIRGFYPNTDIGGGHFYWDINKNKSEHNGGTIISPYNTNSPGTSEWYSAPTSGLQGCWVRRETGKLSVTWFGSIADGVTPDDDAFNAAVALGVTEVPEGTYEISGTVTGAFYSFGPVTVNTGTVNTIKDLMV